MGDPVNVASRMQSSGQPHKVQVTENFKNAVESQSKDFNFEDRGEIEIKGKGKMKTFFLMSKNDKV